MSGDDTPPITWGDTPLARIASVSSMVNFVDFRSEESGDTHSLQASPKSEKRVSYRKGSPVSFRKGSYRKQLSHSPSTQRRYRRSKMLRRMSAPSAIENPIYLDEFEKRRIVIRTISLNNHDDVFEDPDPVDLGKTQEPEDTYDIDACAQKIFRIQTSIKDFVHRRQTILKRIFKIVLFILYMAYFAYAMYYKFGDEGSVRLLVCTIFGALLLALNHISDYVWMGIESICVLKDRPVFARIVRWVFYIAAGVAIVMTLVLLVAVKQPRNLLCLPGLAVFIIMTYVTSSNPTKVCWHPVFWGLAIQYFCGVAIIHMAWGLTVSKYIGDRITEFLAFSLDGAKYVFGEYLEEHRFVFAILTMTVYFSTAVSILYHFGVMQGIIRVLGRTLSFCFHTSPIEALNVAGNIFIGFTEAPLMIRPFLPVMTRSELHTVMTAGFATVAGSMLVWYAEFGLPAHHLLAACVMSAPAALAVSKLSYPETEKTKSSLEDYLRLEERSTTNVIEAITIGATSSIKLVASVAVNVMAFICIFTFLNSTLVWFGDRVGVDGLSFECICSYLLYPIALFMGVDPTDCRPVARMVGVKIFTNELSAFRVLSEYFINRKVFENYTISNNLTDWFHVDDDIVLPAWNNMTLVGGVLSERSEVITTYALCGFSNVGSMGIMLGILGALAPQKKILLTQLVIRALIAGNIACFITACTAGLLYKQT